MRPFICPGQEAHHVADVVGHESGLLHFAGIHDAGDVGGLGRKFVTVSPASALRVNNGLLMRDAAVAGLGIALLPTFLLDVPARKRTLRVLDVGAEGEGATVHIAYPEHLRASAKIRALTAWLREAFGEPAYWDDASR